MSEKKAGKTVVSLLGGLCVVLLAFAIGGLCGMQYGEAKERARGDDYNLRYQTLVDQSDFLSLLLAAKQYKRIRGLHGNTSAER